MRASWLALLPLAYLAVVTALVTIGVVHSEWAKRSAPKDAEQERVFAGCSASFSARLWGLCIESFWQSVAFVLQLAHILRLLPEVKGPSAATPVVLLHGYTENSGTTWWFARRLARDGFNPVRVQFPSTRSPIEQNARFLRARIAAIRADHGGQPVAIVAHSMGGVVARALLLDGPHEGVCVFVALASPFRGTRAAFTGGWLPLGESVQQMRPDSAFMRAYGPERPMPVPTFSLVTIQENVVTPEWAVVVAGAETRVLAEPYGHETALFVHSVYQEIVGWLEQHGVRRAPRKLDAAPAGAPLRDGEGRDRQRRANR